MLNIPTKFGLKIFLNIISNSFWPSPRLCIGDIKVDAIFGWELDFIMSIAQLLRFEQV